MLNLSFIFDDAIHVLKEYSDCLAVVPLPAAVYMMQADVINHYQYALENYLTLTLNEVENSSLRTPYQKWARVTNEDFTILADSHGPAARPTFAASGLGAETDRRRS